MTDFWKNFFAVLEEKTSAQVFETWFKPLRLFSFSPELLCIETPNRFFADWLQENYKALFIKTVFELTDQSPEIKFVLRENAAPSEPLPENKTPLPDQEKASLKKRVPSPSINPQYTFSNFVIGSCNQFAHAACCAVADRPGGTYNPLFLYGGVGLGKTHLMHAIVHQCFLLNPDLKIFYITSEKFTNELINSIRHEKMSDFRKKYRNFDVLLLDDIQFIAGKERTQEEFFHTFNALFELKKQIVVSSDKTPREINNLEERIRSRFEWGLIADIQPPETETKVAILKKKAQANKILLPNEVAFLLADSVQSNIRELEGLLTRVTAYSSLAGRDITVAFAKEVLKDFLRTEKIISPEEIQKIVCKHFNIKTADLKGKKKNSSFVLPRQLAMYLIRKKTSLSFPEIGCLFGGRDHSTVIYSINKIDALQKKNYSVKEHVETLLKKM